MLLSQNHRAFKWLKHNFFFILFLERKTRENLYASPQGLIILHFVLITTFSKLIMVTWRQNYFKTERFRVKALQKIIPAVDSAQTGNWRVSWPDNCVVWKLSIPSSSSQIAGGNTKGLESLWVEVGRAREGSRSDAQVSSNSSSSELVNVYNATLASDNWCPLKHLWGEAVRKKKNFFHSFIFAFFAFFRGRMKSL